MIKWLKECRSDFEFVSTFPQTFPQLRVPPTTAAPGALLQQLFEPAHFACQIGIEFIQFLAN